MTDADLLAARGLLRAILRESAALNLARRRGDRTAAEAIKGRLRDHAALRAAILTGGEQ